MLLIKETYGDKPLSLACKMNFVNMRDNEVYMWLDYVNIVFCLGFSVPIENFSLNLETLP